MSRYIIEEVIDDETGEKKYQDQYDKIFEAMFPIEKGFIMILIDMITLRSIETSTVKSVTKYEGKDKKWMVVVTKNSTYCLQEI